MNKNKSDNYQTENLLDWQKRRLARPLAISMIILFLLQLAFAFHQNQEKRSEIKNILNSTSNIFSLAIIQKNRILLEASSGFLFKHRLIRAICISSNQEMIYSMPFSKNEKCEIDDDFVTESIVVPLESAPGYRVTYLLPRYPNIKETFTLLLVSSFFVFPIFYFVIKVRYIVHKDIIDPFNISLKFIGIESDRLPVENDKTHRIEEINTLIQAFKAKLEEIKLLTDKEAKSAKEAAIGRITAHLSHDLRAPLGTFERLLLAPDESLSSMRSAVKDSLNRLYSMIESLRHSEIENLIQRSNSTINFLYGEETLQNKAEEYSVELVVPKGDIHGVWIDPMKVERAWINLASNAIEAAKALVKVESVKQGSDLFIRVIDDGQGVPQEALSRLFQRGVTYGKAGGTGLGLAYVKQIMQGHGGDVTYRRENGFTIFECRLPQAYPKEEEGGMNSPAINKVPARSVEQKKVSIKLIPGSLALGVCEALNSYNSESFSFSCDWDHDTKTVVLNDDDLLLQAMDEGKDPLQLSKNLDQKQIIDRLIRKFNLI